MKITKDHDKIIRKICYDVSRSTGVDSDDLYAECISKIPRVLKNFNSSLGKPFNSYMKISMRGYALNYCRDKSFLSSIKRTHLNLYQKSKKFNNLEIAAESLMVPLDLLETIHHQVSVSRRYNSINVDEEWRLPLKGNSTSSKIKNLMSEILDEQDQILLEDVYLAEEPEEYLIEVYGEDYQDRVNVLLEIINHYKDDFEVWL